MYIIIKEVDRDSYKEFTAPFYGTEQEMADKLSSLDNTDNIKYKMVQV